MEFTTASPPYVPGNHAAINALDFENTSFVMYGLPENKTVMRGMSMSLVRTNPMIYFFN